MDPFKPRPKTGPEGKIQNELIAMLNLRGWIVLETHGNIYQKGFPDLYATHKLYGPRWIEVKNPEQYSWTPAQKEVFPKLVANGTRIWVLVAATDFEYNKLFAKSNLWVYFK